MNKYTDCTLLTSVLNIEYKVMVLNELYEHTLKYLVNSSTTVKALMSSLCLKCLESLIDLDT